MKIKRLLLTGVTLMFLCMFFTPAVLAGENQEAAITFSDITNHWAAENIIQMAEQGIIEGYPDGTFKPNETITRAEFCAMLVRSLDPSENELLSESMEVYTDPTIIRRAIYQFDDAASIPEWAQEYIGSLVECKVIIPDEDYEIKKDWPARLEADEPITRLEVAGMVGRALKDFDGFRELEDGLESYELHTNFEDDEAIRSSSWSIGVACALGKGLIQGYPDGKFMPESEITRAEAATVLARLLGFTEAVEKQSPKIWSWKTSSYDDIAWEDFLDMWN